MKKKIIFSLFALFLFTIFSVDDAFAVKKITIKNETREKISIAVRYQDYREGDDGGVWVTEGWFPVPAYDQSTLHVNTGTATMYFYGVVPKDIYRGYGGSANDTRDRDYLVSFSSVIYLQGNTKPNDEYVFKVRFNRHYIPENNAVITITDDMIKKVNLVRIK